MLLVLAGLAAWPGGPDARRRLILIVPAAGLAVPLAYYAGLARWDSAWDLSQRLNDVAPPPVWAVVLAVGPLAVPALAGPSAAGDGGGGAGADPVAGGLAGRPGRAGLVPDSRAGRA